MTEPALRLDQLSKNFDDKAVLKGISNETHTGKAQVAAVN